MVTIKWTEQSIQDIENIASFIASDSERYAKIQTNRFFEIVSILVNHPKSGQIVPEVGDDNVRQLLQGNYRIIYKIINHNLIHILTIHHSRRLLSNNPLFQNE